MMDLGDPNLLPVCVLGQGTFGRVFLCRYRKDRLERKVCVKRIIVQNPKIELSMIKEEVGYLISHMTDNDNRIFNHQVYIISQLRHPHIIQFINQFMHAGTVNIIMEYAENGTLRDVIRHSVATGRPLSKDRLHHYFCDMYLGLEYLHIRHVIHRDIKPENMLLNTRDQVKIADFGISAVHAPSKQYQQIMGTPLYMAPEIMRGEPYGFKSDVWSLGCVLYELCMNANPFVTILSKGSNTFEQMHKAVRAATHNKLDCQLLMQRYGSVWSRVCELMVVYDAERRIALPDILSLSPLIMLTVYRSYFDYSH